MAQARTAIQGLLYQFNLSAGFTPPIKQGVGFPSTPLIQDVTKGAYSIVSVYDAGDGARNTTRWAGQTMGLLDLDPPAPGVTAALNTRTLAATGTCTITLSGTPLIHDAVVFSAQPVLWLSQALLANATAGSNDTPTTMAATLAASINTAALYGVTATSTGAVVTVTAGNATPFSLLAANVGNQGARTFETKRMARHVRVTAWAASPSQREAIGNSIDVTLGILSNTGGFYLSKTPFDAPFDTAFDYQPLGDWVSVRAEADHWVEEPLADLYRWDFRVCLEYGTMNIETLYPVLGTSFTFAGAPPLP